MATIQIIKLENFSAEQTQVLRDACTIWEKLLQDDIIIKIKAIFTEAIDPMGLVGMCIPNFVQGNWQGQNITVTTAQGKSVGTEPFVTDQPLDMLLLFNSKLTFNYTELENKNPHFKTNVLHEICHGLGFIGLCNVGKNNAQENIGIFSDKALIARLQPLKGLIPFWNNLDNLTQGYATPFASEFLKNDNSIIHISTNMNLEGNLIKVAPPTLYDIFTTKNFIRIQNNIPQQGTEYYSVVTFDKNNNNNNFKPFTSCDHINYPQGCLMYHTLETQILNPDHRTTSILGMIGWNIRP